MISIALPQMPLLPAFGDFFPSLATVSDPRLQELKEQLSDGNEPPFAFDNGAILRAAPKKRPSHRRTREKLYAPGDKKIQPLQNLGRCPACGHVKRSHFMCMHCFAEIRGFLKAKKKALFGDAESEAAQKLDAVDERIVYTPKYQDQNALRMQRKDWIPKREEPLMYEADKVKYRK